jgi:hypothetical protein
MTVKLASFLSPLFKKFGYNTINTIKNINLLNNNIKDMGFALFNTFLCNQVNLINNNFT